MKLRSSLAVSAVTALTSSAALFAAPVAFAAEAPTSPPPTVTATATPAATVTPTATASATTTPASGEGADKGQDPADKTVKATGTPEASAAPAADKAAAQATGSGPAERIPNPDKGNGPSISFSGLPGDIVVGGKPVNVAIDIKNTTGTKMEFLPFVSLGNVASDKPLRASHIVLEAKIPGSDAWTKVELIDTAIEDGGPSAAIGWFAAQDPEHPGEPVPLVLDKDQALQIQLRLAFTADAPLGETFAFLLGLGSANLEDVEYESASDFYVFNLVAPGAPGAANPEVRPVPPVKLPPKPKPAAKPGQNLAETGGSDASATTYAIVGGVALVGGAGLLVVMRRRKTGGTTPA
ncbi:LPXTG cell wall anchor domain-containing protein [Yinghuangia sp. ASG 101]|uniref:LPXTG cell wall anchor domain-containing protein n=1 Tax=Yinghuangia sp. ASG 101 TaxID=2896848 RepID=UPI001E3B0A95|nr:LPXTG cell wall anchor domain-containing protein [Yinghuangia sp. ASG 101]UGQ14299.1 LPXTG cell wall anchor domain-containing protein [Yinghuangia sp. ASG 101]